MPIADSWLKNDKILMIMRVKTNLSRQTISLIILYIDFIYTLLPTTTESFILYYLPYVLSIIGILLLLTLKSKVTISGYTKWRLLFIVYAFISLYFITVSYFDTFLYVKRIVLQSIVLFQVLLTLRHVDMMRILKVFITAVGTVLIYMLCIADYSKILAFRWGGDIFGYGWNSNTIGMMASYSILFIEIIINNCKENGLKYKSYRLFQAVLLVFSLLSGSRKAILILLIGIFVLSVSLGTGISSRLKKCFAGGLIVCIAFLAVFEIPFLNEIAGQRILHLFHYLDTGAVEDGSMRWRAIMNVYGLELFLKKPIIGSGLNSFKYYFGQIYTDYATYAHNNYIELLVDGGIICLALYYFSYAYIIIKALKSKCKIKKQVIVIMALIAIFDYALVSYENMMIQLFVVFMFGFVRESEYVTVK